MQRMKKHFEKNPMVIIFFTIFIDLLGFGILIPVIPLLLADPRSPYFLLPQGMTVDQGYILLGILTAVFPLMQFIAAPILGQLSDKYGRKKLLAVSLFGTCISYVIFALGIITKNLPILFFARALDGITGGNISIAQATIADITAPKDRAKNFGLIGAAFGLGFIVGPYIGGKLSDPQVIHWFNAATPFWFAAIVSFLNVISIYFFLPETHANRRLDLKINWTKSIHNIVRAYSMKDLRVIFTTVFLYTGGFTFFTTFFSLFLIHKFSFRQSNIGDFFSYVGIWVAFAQAVVTRQMAKRFKEHEIVKVTIFGTALFILVYFLPTVWWQLLFVVPFFAICNGLTFANITALISRSVEPSVQGEILGINASVQAFSQALPALLSGYIAARLTPESPLVVSALTIAFAGLLFLILYKPKASPLHVPQEEL